jgi:predicted nucleotidyltransferase
VNGPRRTREIREIAAQYSTISSGILERVVDRLLEAFSPERIILFGSYAEGHATRDSDLDLLVIISHPITKREEQTRLLGLFSDVPVPIQVTTIFRGEFEETKDVSGGIAHPAAKYGKVIYEKPGRNHGDSLGALQKGKVQEIRGSRTCVLRGEGCINRAG